MCTNNTPKVEEPKEDKPAYKHVCGYCGSTKEPVPYEQHFGPGAHGWDCCPDCGGV